MARESHQGPLEVMHIRDHWRWCTMSRHILT